MLRKRAREDDPETTTKPEHGRRWLGTWPPAQEKPLPESLLPTPPACSAASPKQHAKSTSHSYHEPHTAAAAAFEPALEASKRRRPSAPALDPQPAEPQPAEQQEHWSINHFWQMSRPTRTSVVQETWEDSDSPASDVVEDHEIVASIEEPFEWEDEEGDRMSQSQDGGGSQDQGSTVPDRRRISSPAYRGTLKMNRIMLDDHGIEIPSDVEELITRHIRKERLSPMLNDDETDNILRKIRQVWNSPECTVTDIMALPLLPLHDVEKYPSLLQGGNNFWSSTPLPRNDTYPLVTPRTDRHLGYQTTLGSEWAAEELAAADHPRMRPYSQPSRENLFPSFLIEAESEATGGTAYEAEAQLATAGCQRVRSMIWILDQIDPQRTRKASDAIVFSAVLTQRQVIAHVHYYDPDKDMFRMSFIDSFYLARELQECVEFGKSVREWLVEIQQPAVREALRRMYPVTQLWDKGRSASAVAADDGASDWSYSDDGASASFGSDDGRTAKNARTEEISGRYPRVYGSQQCD
ncbi:hypothetical protein QQS21_006752 [Conoideocrella luteorostrata]|uniref:Uncharacterized protein n=1 Tax=Conoideocrella luteorostrata TaxID=1105319 RepID=A0AAJ0CM55_9HYPO|nr:hypothetical protein QQS21_006752 [Conoideocrella luteorostrata]